MSGLHLELSDEMVDAIVERAAARAAELVRERIGETSAAAASPYLTPTEAAELLRSSRQRVYDLLSDGRLERVKDGSRVLVRRADVEAHLRPTGNGSGTGRRVAR